jgi:hypothetical protein
MEKYKITISIEEEIEAENEEEAEKNFWEEIETAPQQTLATNYIAENLKIEKVD